MDRTHEFINVAEDFCLSKRRSRGRNIIGQWAIMQIPGQRGGNVTLCAVIINLSLHHTASSNLFGWPSGCSISTGKWVRKCSFCYWDCQFSQSLIRQWFNTNSKFVLVFLPPYSLYRNPTKDFFSAWMNRWMEKLQLTQTVQLVTCIKDSCPHL